MNHSHENKVNIIEMSHRNDNEKIDVSKEGPLYKVIPEDSKINVEIQNKGEYIKVSAIETENNKINKDEQFEDPLLGKMILDVDKGLLVDEKEFDGMGNDNIRDSDIFDRVEEEVNMMHPGRKNNEGLTEKFPVCKTDTGIMGCFQPNGKTDLLPMGLGIVVYFKILKAFATVFFIINIINIPLYYIYSTSHAEFKASGYKDIFFKTTIGNIGSTLQKCMKIPYNTFAFSKTLDLQLDCLTYNISSILEFGATTNQQSELENRAQCQNYTTFANVTVNPACSLKSNLNTLLKSQKCLQNSTCSVQINLDDFRKNCIFTDNTLVTPALTPNNFYLTYECYDKWIRATNYLIARDNFAYGVVIIDLVSMTSLVITLLIIAVSQRRTDHYFKENVVEISNYTIHFKKLKLKNENLREELNSLLEHIYKVNRIGHPDETYDDIIYDINYPILTYKKLDLILEKNGITEKINNKKTDLEIFEKQFSVHQIEKMRTEVNLLREKEDILRTQILKSNEDEMKTVDDMYMTFTHQKYRNYIMSNYSRSKCRRCCLICCCQSHKINHLYFKNDWLVVQESTDQPSNIRWENVPYSTSRRCIRKFFAVLIAIIVILASFGIVIGTKYAQIEINKQIDVDIDCTFFPSNIEDSMVIAEVDLSERARVYTNCFCRNLLIQKGVPETKNITILYYKQNSKTQISYKPCDNWVDIYLYSQSLMIGTFMLVPFVNVILSILLALLTELERNKSVSLSASSNMWKSFLLQLAIVILIVNLSITDVKIWNSSFPLFTGIYSDLDPRWYQNVGVTIIFCMILNIMTPHTEPLLTYFYTYCKRSCDSKCCNGGRKTKRNTRSEYIELYLGPQFDIGGRYSQILTTIFVVLIYSSGMPILYVCCFLFLFFTYWIDKFLILRFYRNPPHINLYMSKLFYFIILFGVIIHYCFGIWIYGNDQILTNSANTYLQSVSDWVKNLMHYEDKSFAADVLNRITYGHNIIVLIYLCLLFVYFVIRVFLSDIFKHLFGCCCSCTKVPEKTQDVCLYDGKIII